ncbi:hypothetical protein OUZ56_021821 [Daphnia magna]|uniref:Uncharacterized protein n=1 Tax=Daphnia magna TaxID=35525 RepID=A0ABR0AUK7_9CRUS|nr:hypothetical protein OUZ56_021821 [Daphnia magna]
MVKQYPPDKVNEEAALPQVNKETVGLPVKVVVSQQQHGKKTFTQQQQLKEVNLQEQENNKTVGTALEKEAVDQSQLIKHANEQPQLEKEAPSQPIIKENLVPKENSDEITLVKTVGVQRDQHYANRKALRTTRKEYLSRAEIAVVTKNGARLEPCHINAQ